MNEPMPPQEALIRRYEAGERDPALLKALDALAWSQFHDPWEERTLPSTTRTEEERVDPSEDPQKVYPISLDRLKTVLHNRDLTYFEQGSALLVRFDYEPKCDREVILRVSLEGEREDVLRIHMEGDRRTAREDFPKALELCNRFNREYRWPKTYLEIPSEAEGIPAPSGKLVTCHQLDLETGIHDGLLEDVICCAVGASWIFWEMAHKEGL